MKALVIENDDKILQHIKKGLREEGFVVDTSNDGEDGLYLAQTNKYEIIILGWSLPKYDGIQISKILRINHNTTPILMVTRKGSVENKVKSLESGVDDYMTKPFSFMEFIARIRSLIRRANYDITQTITIDTLSINVAKRTVKRANKMIELTRKEFDILIYLITNKNSTVTHTNIQEQIWGINEITSSNVINVFIHHLRKKIDLVGERSLIKTIRGSGYKIESL